MKNKKTWKLLIVAAVLFTVLADGLAAQQVGREYQVTNVEYLGDFEDGDPRDRAMNEILAKSQRQNPGFTFERRDTEYLSSLEIHLITWACERTIENANIDSTYAVFISSEGSYARKYIIFIQYLPFVSNPYYYWVYRGNKQ